MRPEDIEISPRQLVRDNRDGAVRVRWLGTAGFEIEHDGWVVLIDPYITRASLGRCVTSHLQADVPLIRRHVARADAIVCGHTHFDHVLDVPAIARFTGAKVFGSRSAVTLCRAAGIPDDRLVDVQSATGRSETVAEVGPFELRFVPSVHSSLVAGRIPFPGDITDCDQVPARMHHYRCGAVFGVTVRVAGRSLYHIGSANQLDDVRPSQREADLLLLCVAGWTTSPNLVSRVLRNVSPGAVLLSHWDNFFLPIQRGAQLLPALQMPRLVDELVRESNGATVGTLPLMGDLFL